MREGDYLVELQGRDVKWSSHEQVVGVVQGAGHSLRLTVVTPLKPWAKHKSVSYATNEVSDPFLGRSLCLCAGWRAGQ